MKLKYFLFMLFSIVLIAACSKDDPTPDPDPDPDPEPVTKTHYFLGIEAATDPATDILSSAASLTSGTVSPIGNGFEQPGWSSFFNGPNAIYSGVYTSAPEYTKYEMKDGELTKGSSFFTDLGIYAHDFVDKSNMVLIGSPREGLSEKKIYHVDTDKMEIINTVISDFGNNAQDSLLGFPVDVKVMGNKMFVAYYNMHARGDFSTPKSNVARVAVFDYPSFNFIKEISDSRTTNISRYYSTNGLEADEDGNIYTYSPSSLACGYAPTPEKNCGILRIKKGETEFDPNYFIDFEELSGGYKINDMFYVANGKAVVRVLKEDETNPQYLWATYAPIGETPLMDLGILDLNTKTFTLLPDVPKSGGGWNAAHLVEGNKLYIGVSNLSYSSVYVIDVEAGTATEGVDVDGNYAKGILSLTTVE